MQEIKMIDENQTLASSVAPINNSFSTLLSQNGGTSFPTTNLVLGQTCFRTDELALYVLANVELKKWVKIAQLTLTYVNKEYVDSIRIPLSRVDNLLDTSTQKIKNSLIDTGNTYGKIVAVGADNKIPTNLIDTGTTNGKIVAVGGDGKVSNSVINVGAGEGQIPILGVGGKLSPSTIPTSVVRFDADNSITFPNGNRLFIGG